MLRGEQPNMSKLKSTVMDQLAIPVGFVAILLLASMTAAASIEEALKAGVITAAGMIELYLLVQMFERIGN